MLTPLRSRSWAGERSERVGRALAVSIAGGLAERKRPFSLLRLTGAPTSMLRRVVGLEAAAPLLVTAVVSIGAGLLTAHLFLRAQLAETLQPPGVVWLWGQCAAAGGSALGLGRERVAYPSERLA